MILAMFMWKLIIIMAAVITDVSTQDRVGCFVDARSRVLGSFRSIPSLTLELCLSSCFSDHYVFAGVEAGGQCYCGNSTDHTKNGAQADDSDCNRYCLGDMSQTCGGGWRIEIFKDHDECSDENNGGCNQNCVDGIGNYHCTCHEGYALEDGDQFNCVDIDECRLEIDKCNQMCDNTKGRYTCSCWLGYELAGTERFNCTDIDECSIASAKCNQNCSNTDGGYNCTCLPGYDLVDDEKYVCTDIDECINDSQICNQTCNNTPGAYECSCDDGYDKLDRSSDYCIDVNECDANNGGCDHNCSNSLGSYRCECRDGYFLNSPNGFKCTEMIDGNSGNVVPMAAGIASAGVVVVIVIVVVIIIMKRRQCKRSSGTHEELSPAKFSSTMRSSAYENVSIDVDGVGVIVHNIEESMDDSSEGCNRANPQIIGNNGSNRQIIQMATEPQQHKDDNTTMESPPDEHSNIIPVQHMNMYVEGILKNNADIDREFKSVMSSYGECTNVMGMQWKLKNKYKNIMPYEHNRVRLTKNENPYSDYINASYINFPNSTATIIAAQGPIQETIADFWRMIWEQNVRVIVMLTNVAENMKRKCAYYWPDNDNISVDKFAIKLMDVAEFPDYVIRTFAIHPRADSSSARHVQHYQFTAWPDKDVPDYTAPFLRFNHKIKTANVSGENTVVHCSAGVGRTGTFIAFNRLLSLVSTDQNFDVVRCLRKLREQRTDMIQTLKQYIFLHSILRDAMAIGETAIPACDFAAVYANFQGAKISPSAANIRGQYEIISRVQGLTAHKASAGNKTSNKAKNRTNIVPNDARRVCLNSRNSDFINAVRIVGYDKKDSLIATQWPLDSTVNDFWKMVQDHNIRALVVLEDMTQTAGYPSFLPSSDRPVYAGDVCIQLVGEISKVQTIGVMRVKLSNNSQSPSDNPYSNVETLHSADQTGNVVDVLSMNGSLTVEQVYILTERMKGLNLKSTPTVVISRDGGQLCGLFIVIHILLQMLKKEKEMDIFYAVHQIKICRPEFFASEESYEQLHEMMKSYCDQNM